MSFDHEFIHSLLSGEDNHEYNEDVQERYANSPVFDEVKKLHVELSGMRLRGEELVKTWNEHQEIMNLLDVQASREGVAGQIASLSGRGVEIPKFETDLTAVASYISLDNVQELDASSLEKYYQQDEVQGIFAGFTIRFMKVGDDLYAPRVAYQLSNAVVDTPHARLNLFTTGLVGEAQLVFQEDVKREKVTPVLSRLFELCGDTAANLNAINMALNSTSTYDASLMRHIAFHAEKIANAADKEVLTIIEDNLVDLIAQYIGSDEKLHIKTPIFYLSPENKEIGVEYYQDDDGYSVGGKIQSLLFLNRAAVKDGKITYRERRSLHVALKHGERFLFTPLVEVAEFAKV